MRRSIIPYIPGYKWNRTVQWWARRVLTTGYEPTPREFHRFADAYRRYKHL